jgi:biotin-dependent carboxylase-like uncharacterized protein
MTDPAGHAVRILRTGPQLLIEDLGRPGLGHLGVPPSGALDTPALRLANRLVGNPESAAGLEVLLGGTVVRAVGSCTAAVTGPPVRLRHTRAGRTMTAASHRPLHLADSDELALAAPRCGLRNYLALSGGVAVPTALGSRSTDLLSGIGPAPCAAGDLLPLGRPDGLPAGADELSAPAVPERLTVPAVLGPRDDWFDDPAGQLAAAGWTVSPTSNRIGVRLEGTALLRTAGRSDRELPSEGTVTGAVQVPGDGRPVIFLADRPTTGGYPVIAVVDPAALPLLAQARPGTPLRIRPHAS